MKVLAIICVVALSGTFVAVTADDSPAEAAAPTVAETAEPSADAAKTTSAVDPAPSDAPAAAPAEAKPETTPETAGEPKVGNPEPSPADPKNGAEEPKKDDKTVLINKAILGLNVKVEKDPAKNPLAINPETIKEMILGDIPKLPGLPSSTPNLGNTPTKSVPKPPKSIQEAMNTFEAPPNNVISLFNLSRKK